MERKKDENGIGVTMKQRIKRPSATFDHRSEYG